MLDLYHGWGATCGRVARLAFTEKGVAWNDVIVTDRYSPEYTKLNPNNYVPTLVHDDRVIIESSVIVNYVDDLFEGPSLKPADPYDRARMYFRIKMRDERYHYAINAISFGLASKRRFGGRSREELESEAARIPDPGRAKQRIDTMLLGMDAPQVANGVRTMDKALSQMEEDDLSHGPWLAGDQYSLADATMTPYLLRLAEFGLEHLWTESRPRVTDWYERIQARPSFDSVINAHREEERLKTMHAEGTEYWPILEKYLKEG